ncbi:MAG: hypothetical protein LDL44_00375 [Caenispirillum sp.]|nr:hypothetical protein [Caenispirillum sp.]
MSNDAHLLEAVTGEGRPAFTTRDLIGILFKHWRTILFSFVFVSVLVAAGVWSLPPTYIAEGKVLVRTEQQGNPSFFSGIAAYREPWESDPVNRKIETEMELLATRELSERVVRKLELTYDTVYHKPLTLLLRPLADAYDWLLERLFSYPPDPDKYGFKGTVREFNKSFTVEPLKSKSADTTSNMILVKLKATSSQVAQQSLQTLLEEYVHLTVEQNQLLGRQAYALVERNLIRAQEELEAAKERERVFIAENGATLTSRFGFPSLGAIEQAKEKVPTLSKAGEQSTVGALRAHLIDMELQLIELRNVFTDSSENVRQQQRAIAEMKSRIEHEIRRTAENEKTLAALSLDVKTAEAHYIDLRRKLEQIALYLQLNPAEASSRLIAETPLLPKTSEWRKNVLVTVLGALAGLLLGLGLAGYREYTDHRLETPEAVEYHLCLKTLTVVPLLDGEGMKNALATAGRQGAEGETS